MKKIALILAALVIGLVSCDDGTASGGGGSGKFKFEGHYDTWQGKLAYKGSLEGDAWIQESWKEGCWEKADIDYNLYFEGDQYWELRNNKMVGGGLFTYTNTHISMYLSDDDSHLHGTQRYTVIDKDTVYFHYIDDDPSGISERYSHILGVILKRSWRKGRIKKIDRTPTFVDD